MIRLNKVAAGEAKLPELNRDGEDQLLLIDDAEFVSAFTEAALRQGDKVVCVQCADPHQTLRALVVMIDRQTSADEAAGSVGFCSECYRDLAELIRHGAVLRASMLSSS